MQQQQQQQGHEQIPLQHPLAALPPGHFLSLPPTFANDPRSSLTTASHAAPELAPNVASLAAADFDVDVRTGFLPPGGNVERLPHPWDVWEDALDAASGDGVTQPGLVLGAKGDGRDQVVAWRNAVEGMDVVDHTALGASLPLMRRAHLVLAYLLHFYVHSAPPLPHATSASDPTPPDAISSPTTPATSVPASISIPLLAISPLVGLPPILTYADTVLWNVAPKDASAPTSLTSNPPTRTLASFTRTRSEDMFYIVSAECEVAGAAALRLMRQSLDELFLGDELAIRRLTSYLRQLATQIDRVGDITLKMMSEVDPEDFYHLIRPWFRGGDADGPQSPGWLFLGTDLTDAGSATATEAENPLAAGRQGRKFSGPSAGQSSLIHAIDIFLTVDHSERDDERQARESQEAHEADPTQTTTTAPRITLDPTPVGTATGTAAPVEATFLQRMLQYMPLPHRTFLLHLSSHPTPLRPLVIARAETHPHLAQAYDDALAALKRFRDKHMRVVTRFIVQQARRQPSARIRRILGEVVVDDADEGDDAKVAEEHIQVDGLRGTGGTPLIRFLKRCRDNTSRAMLGAS